MTEKPEDEKEKKAEELKEDLEKEKLKELEKNIVENHGKKIIGAEITEEMEKAYIDYAMSVIVSRALPSVEDGLKPVQRRILFAMHEMGLEPNKQTRKCARIVGDVLGKFHPHGDLAVYDALVRLAQDFSLRYPLIIGQGNFGCFTADTKVALADGRNLSFKELVKESGEGKENFCYTIKEDSSIGIEKIENPRVTKTDAEVIKITLDNDKSITCTPNHNFMLRNGEYKEAKDLTKEDSLMPLHKRIPKIKDIKSLKEKIDVYDIEVPRTHNFALASGIFVHNSIDGDPPAAMRYSEAKLAPISTELLEDIEKETVEFLPNFDNSLKEPSILPAKLPNLLINGATGIAVGMATNIPPHNLTEVCDAITSFINKPEISIEQLSEIVTGPDFPTGGSISGDIKQIYSTGNGRVIVRGRTTIEEERGKQKIIITEIPYMVNKSELVTQIAKLVQEKKLPDVSDIRDESAKGRIRVVIELRRGADSKFTINRLYKFTRLQDNFDINLLALVNGKPQVLNLKQIIENYVKYRKSIITKRTKFELKKSEERLEIVLGLIKAVKSLDDVIKTIRNSSNHPEASQSLMKKFGLTQKQVNAILDMRLASLTALEQDKLNKEEKTLEESIKEFRKILGDEKEVLAIIKKDISELKRKYGDERKTHVLAREIQEISEVELVQKKEVVVTITEKGYAKRMDLKTYKEQKRGGKGVIGSDLSTGDFVKQLIVCSTHDYLLFFTDKGKVYWLKAYQVPETERYAKGKALINILNIKDERIQSVLPVKEFKDFIIMTTERGIIKKMPLSLLSNPRASGVRVISLPPEGDVVVEVNPVKEKQEVLLVTKKGQAIRFNSNEVRPMGRASYGVTGIKLEKDDKVVSVEVLPLEKDKTTILSITEKGYGKRSEIEDYRLTGRAGKGVINLKVNEKVGDVISAISVKDKDSAIATTAKGMVIRSPVEQIRVMGRATQGVRIVKLHPEDKVVDLVKVEEAE